MGKILNIGQRLKEERERLGLNQEDFAAVASVGRKTQFNYETGVRMPDAAYLAATDSIGVDVLYVVTGKRVVAQSFRPKFNPSLMGQVVAAIDGELVNRKSSLDASRKAKLYVALYEFSLEAGQVNTRVVGPLVDVA